MLCSNALCDGWRRYGDSDEAVIMMAGLVTKGDERKDVDDDDVNKTRVTMSFVVEQAN